MLSSMYFPAAGREMTKLRTWYKAQWLIPIRILRLQRWDKAKSNVFPDVWRERLPRHAGHHWYVHFGA